jgi:hypothetical protein
MESAKISVQLLNAILQYLGNRPWVEADALIKDSDWTQVADAPVDKAVWATYRQALRDITTQTDPFNIVWPIL